MLNKFIWMLGAGLLWVQTAGAQTTVNRIEYFIDTDPGYGAATSVSFAAATTVTDLAINVPVDGLGAGLHRLFVRVRDSNNRWSVVDSKSFFKDNASLAPATLSRIEYFIDTDPGYGAATSVSFTAAPTITDVPFTVPLTGLSTGYHTLLARAQTTEGRWSVVARQAFFKDEIVQPDLVKLEYFVDSDPGLGAATAVPFTRGLTINNLDYTIPLSGVTNGPHKLYVRAQNALGKWSVVAIRDFVVQDNVITASGLREWCRKAVYAITFTATGTYQAANQFTAQLSNAAGDFSTFTNVGTVAGTTSGTIMATLPNGVVAGTGYRLRVVSSSPALTNMPALAVTISETCACAHTAKIEAPNGTNFCAGSSVVVTAAGDGSTGPFTYNWRQGTTDIASTASLTITRAGTYTTDVTDKNGCVATTVVAISQAPNLPVSVSGASSFCGGQSTPLATSVTGGSGPYTYQWRLENTPISGASASVHSAITGGTYSVFVLDSRGCTGTSPNLVVTQKPTPNVTITASGATAISPEAGVGLSVPLVAGQTYQWLRNGQPISGATTSSYSATQAATYAVTAIRDGCTATSTALVVSLILAVEPTAPGVSLTVSPNPATGYVQAVLLLDVPAPATLRLFDASGRQWQSQVFDSPAPRHEHRFDLTNVPGGVYLLRAETGDKRLGRKLLKEH